MVRFAIALIVVLLAGCGPDDSLPASVPTVPADSGLSDAGLAFLEACSAAGCIPSVCEPLDGGSVRCGVACGAACGSPCEQNRCDDPDAGWVDVYCNMAGVSMAWTRDATCDDGNGCTKNDVCQNGTCAGVANTGHACDDGNVCTTGDACTAAATCAGTPANSQENRYFNSGASTYAYAPPGGWSFNGWSGDGAIFNDVPGGQTLHLLFDNTAVDRIISLQTSQGSYAASGANVGKGLSSPAPGTVELKVSTYTCGAVSSNCASFGGSSAKRHYFYTSGHGSPPAGSGVGAGIWVCPL